MDEIHEFSILGKLHMSRRRILITPENIHQFQSAGRMVQPVHVHMIHPKICRAEEFIVASHLHTADMRPGRALRHTSHTFAENLVGDISDAPVFIQPQCRNLSIVIARRKQKLILIVRRQIAAAHAVDGTLIDSG